MKLEVIEIVDHADGSATITFDMDRETLLTFAKFGILQTLTDAATKMIKEERESNHNVA